MRIKKGLFPSRFLKLILAGVVGVLGGILVITSGNLPETETGQLPPAPPQAVNKIEISAGKKLILNSETKETILDIEKALTYLKTSGFAYNPETLRNPARYPKEKFWGECFFDAALSNSKQKIVFSTACLDATTLAQSWIGTYDLLLADIVANSEPSPEPIKFLTAGGGKNFIWSENDETITYEAIFPLPPGTLKRTINSTAGTIEINASNWKTYRNAGYGFEIKYPAEWETTEKAGAIVTFAGKQISQLSTRGASYVIQVRVTPKKSGVTLFEQIKGKGEDSPILRKINDRNFYYYKTSITNILFYEYYTERDEKVFSLSMVVLTDLPLDASKSDILYYYNDDIYSPNIELKDQLETLKQIASTLEFIERKANQ